MNLETLNIFITTVTVFASVAGITIAGIIIKEVLTDNEEPND